MCLCGDQHAVANEIFGDDDSDNDGNPFAAGDADPFAAASPSSNPLGNEDAFADGDPFADDDPFVDGNLLAGAPFSSLLVGAEDNPFETQDPAGVEGNAIESQLEEFNPFESTQTPVQPIPLSLTPEYEY